MGCGWASTSRPLGPGSRGGGSFQTPAGKACSPPAPYHRSVKLYHEETTGGLREVLEETVLAWPGVTAKKMFGCPGYRADGELFAFLVDGGLVITKLDEDARDRWQQRLGGGPFEPGKQTIARWLQVPLRDEDDLAAALDAVRESHDAARNG